MRVLTLALLLAAPALAQSQTDEPISAPPPVQAQAIDPQLVGAWALDEVVEAGFLGQMGAEIDDMALAFGADGVAEVTMTMTQDQETSASERTFAFSTPDGQIVSEGDNPVAYAILDDGRLQLVDPMGLVVRFARTGS